MATAMNASFTLSCPQNETAHDGTLLCHWTNSPGARGTLNIFWLCISTLGLCAWNAVHPDVPRPNTPWWRVYGKRVWMLFVGLFMPEMLVLVALAQLRLAWQLLVDVDRKTRCPTEFPWWMYLVTSWRPKNGNPDSPAKRWMKALRRWMARRLRCLRVHFRSDSTDSDRDARDSLHPSDTSQQAHNSPRPAFSDLAVLPGDRTREDPWTVTLNFYAGMRPAAVSDRAVLDRAREHPWTLTHSFYAVMNGFVDEKGRTIVRPFRDENYQFNEDWSKSVLRRLELPPGDPKRIADVSQEDIEDRGKADALAKSILLWQLFVFLARCFARWDQSLPLSLLEVTTIGHSLCSVLAMVLWWYKPHSIGEATVINRQGPLPSLPGVEWRKVLSWTSLAHSMTGGASQIFPLSGRVTFTAIGVLYGLPHLLGVSVHFRTLAGQPCWELATVVVALYPVFVYIHEEGWPVVDTPAAFVLPIILIVLYPMASMFIVGESVRQIFALPVESFLEPQLPTYLPSFS